MEGVSAARIFYSWADWMVTRSLEVRDPLGLVEVGGVVDLHLLVHGGQLLLDGVLAVGVLEAEGAVGAGVGRVHDEDDLGLGAAI